TNCELQINGSLTDMPDSFFDVFFDIDIMQNAVTQGYIVIHGSATVLVFGSYDTTPTHYLTVANGGHLVLNIVSAAEVEEEGEVVMEQGSLWESNAPLCVTTTGSITFTDGGGGGSGACIACPGFTALTPGSFIPALGTLEITSALGVWPQHLNIGPGNHAFNLVINSSGPVCLDNDCDIYGDLHIIHGPLDVSTLNREIRLYGSWTDDTAPLGFEARNGTVRFLGGGAGSGADIFTGGGEESFFDVIINKPAGTVTSHCGLQLAGDLAIWPDSFFDVFFDVLVDGDLDLLGDLHCSVPLTLTLHGRLFSAAGSHLLMGDGLLHCDNADLPRTTEILGTIVLGGGSCAFDHHHLTILSSGAIVISGGGGAGGNVGCTGLTALTPGSFVPSHGILRLTGDPDGVLEHLNLASGNHCCGLTIDAISPVQLDNDCDVLGDLHILQGTLDVSTADRLLRVGGNWVNDNPSLGFEARNGTVIFGGGGGGGACSISAGGLREEFHNLVIDKALSTDIVTLDDHVCTLGDGVCDIIRGTLYVNDHELTVSGNCNIAGGGILFLDGGICAMGEGRTLTVNSGGTCKAHGNRNRESRMKGKEDTGRWKLKVNSGGHISAKQTEFKHLREEGVKVYPGGIIDPDGDFDECRFNSGAAGCTFLTLDNSQALTIDAIEFVSGSSEQYNIAKLENAGHIMVESCSGNFTGPLHEYDPHGRIEWVGFDPNLVISGFEVSDPDPMYPDLISYTVHVLNDSDYPVTSPFNLHLFLNRDTPPELYEAGDLVHSCGPLPGHGVCSHTFTDVGYLPPDIWHSWTCADPENVILEEEETDNLAGPLTVTWRPLPNLVVTEFTASDYNPVVGTPVNLHVEVTNQSPTTIEVDCIWIRIYDPVTGELIHEECVPVDDGLLGFGVLELDVSHTRYAPLTELLAVWADPLNAIPESNESDNQAELPQPLVWSELPNLVITQFYASDYNPFVCDTVTYHVEIQNQSTMIIITGINLRRWNPDTQQYEDYWIEGPIMGWGVVTLDFGDSSAEAGTQLWIAIADPDNLIEESNEADNQLALPEMITWHPLPPVGETSIARLGGDLGRLTWSYPIWVSRFRIHHGDDPYGELEYLGHTIDSFFDVYLSDPRDFYQIKAERDLPPAK
ncbi:MAG TPA: hypothetical protein PKH19_02860, partial [Candidatus Syntrophosphaera sp.]|nr:hypothetical protein [Candidatus Syntrophosphaera sp.]